MTYRFKHIVEYAALRTGTFVLGCLPYRVALALGWGVARCAYVAIRKRRRMALARIAAVYGTRFGNAERRRIAWISFRNFVFNVIELSRLGRTSRRWFETHYAADEAARLILPHVAQGKAGIIAVPHCGNWEMAAVYSHISGVPVLTIGARQRNPLVNRYISRLRSAPGIETIERGAGTLRLVAQRMRMGSFLAILPDVRMRGEGVEVPFLGGVMNAGPGMAGFARRFDVPIFPCVAIREGWTRHRIIPGPVIASDKSLDKATDIARMTKLVLAFMEKEIDLQPGQWFWYNKRWVLDPLTEADRTSEKEGVAT